KTITTKDTPSPPAIFTSPPALIDHRRGVHLLTAFSNHHQPLPVRLPSSTPTRRTTTHHRCPSLIITEKRGSSRLCSLAVSPRRTSSLPITHNPSTSCFGHHQETKSHHHLLATTVADHRQRPPPTPLPEPTTTKEEPVDCSSPPPRRSPPIYCNKNHRRQRCPRHRSTSLFTDHHTPTPFADRCCLQGSPERKNTRSAASVVLVDTKRDNQTASAVHMHAP
ncbi:hypothetical protein Dimus_003953, partial [Dionaea muscipula]